MILDTEKLRCMLIDHDAKYVGSKYKINEEDERPTNEPWPKQNPYIKTPERYGKAFNYSEYCKKDIEMTRKVASKMSKIRRTNDPRMNHNTGNFYAVVNGKAYVPESITARTGFREQMEYEFSVAVDPRYAVENTMLAIKDVIFNPPATIVFWGDDSKTVVKCQNGEEYDPEKGLTMAFFKKMHGNKGHYFNEIKKWTEKYYEKYSNDSNGAGVEVVFTANDWVEMIKKISDTSKLIAEMEEYRAAHRKFVTIQDHDELPKVEDNEKLKELVSRELNTKDSIRWAIFYARVDQGENEGYIRHALVYKHKSSATRAAKRLISKLPAGVMYEWYVDSIDTSK